jgi:hypothetical protein
MKDNWPMNAKPESTPGATYAFRQAENGKWEWAIVPPNQANALFPPALAKHETFEDAVRDALGGPEDKNSN